MPFPNVKRVIYQRNPLIEVVCQLRFPRILMINEKQPAEFQERIRDDYPLYQVAIERQQQITMDLGAKEIAPTPRILQSETINNYRFSSLDEKWHINLTSTFIALSTSNYDRWESFIEHLQKPLNVLLEIYRPPIFERVGLRYVDAFTRSSLNLGDVPWVELIQPFALGFMSKPEISGDFINQNTTVELDIGNGAIAQINIMKGFVGNTALDFPLLNEEESFIVDSDMYVLRKNAADIESSLTYLHDYSTKLIRSIITEKLHKAMEPIEL